MRPLYLIVYFFYNTTKDMENLLLPALEHIKRLLKDDPVPPLEGDLARIPELREIHNELKTLREILNTFSADSLSQSDRGQLEIPDCLKVFLSRMEATLQEYQKKEEALSALTENLRMEMKTHNSAMAALQKSESRFKYLASHDPLTGAMNRRSFMDRAVQELNDSARHRISCGIIMMDIDHFKKFNDTYGHLAGDEALRHTVRVISSYSRRHDFLGRYGGEEFVFFFDHADKATSLVIAERIRAGLEKKPILLEIGPVTITASLGVALAAFPKNPDYDKLGEYLEILIKNADTAMYNAKKAGRNLVVFFDQESQQLPGTLSEKNES